MRNKPTHLRSMSARSLLTAAMAVLVMALWAPEAFAQARTVQPGAPGSPSTVLDPADLTIPERPRHTEADVLFMQNMIHHHLQAVAMSRLAYERTERPEILLLAERIERSQDDEIAFMSRWLELRGEEVPEVDVEAAMHHGQQHEHHDQHHHDQHATEHADHEMMAGMLTPEQMEELAEARDEDFDRLMLEFMIYHHEGAIEMVGELFRAPGAAQDSDIFQFASHVEADQEAEILRMERLLWIWSMDPRTHR